MKEIAANPCERQKEPKQTSTLKWSQSVLALIYSTYVLLPPAETKERTNSLRIDLGEAFFGFNLTPASRLLDVSAHYFRVDRDCVLNNSLVGMSVQRLLLMFLSLELVVVIELSIYLSVVGSSRVVRNLVDLNCYKGSFVFAGVNFYGREEGVELRAGRLG